MTRVLVTAFESYDHWQANASWLALMELTREMPETPQITTRLYPVDFDLIGKKLEEDLAAEFDFAFHLGQSPGASRIQLEAIALNVGGTATETGEMEPLVSDGPVAYRTDLPLGDWAGDLRSLGIPAAVSYHAGTYLCNAAFYWSQHLIRQRGWRTRSLFIHLPLELTQVTGQPADTPAWPRELSGRALRRLVELTIS